MLVTLEETKKYLRITDDNEDLLISDLIYAAQNFAQHFLGYNLNEVFGDKKELPLDLKIALYMHITVLYDNRGSEVCPNESINIYHRYRKILI